MDYNSLNKNKKIKTINLEIKGLEDKLMQQYKAEEDLRIQKKILEERMGDDKSIEMEYKNRKRSLERAIKIYSGERRKVEEKIEELKKSLEAVNVLQKRNFGEEVYREYLKENREKWRKNENKKIDCLIEELNHKKIEIDRKLKEFEDEEKNINKNRKSLLQEKQKLIEFLRQKKKEEETLEKTINILKEDKKLVLSVVEKDKITLKEEENNTEIERVKKTIKTIEESITNIEIKIRNNNQNLVALIRKEKAIEALRRRTEEIRNKIEESKEKIALKEDIGILIEKENIIYDNIKYCKIEIKELEKDLEKAIREEIEMVKIKDKIILKEDEEVLSTEKIKLKEKRWTAEDKIQEIINNKIEIKDTILKRKKQLKRLMQEYSALKRKIEERMEEKREGTDKLKIENKVNSLEKKLVEPETKLSKNKSHKFNKEVELKGETEKDLMDKLVNKATIKIDETRVVNKGQIYGVEEEGLLPSFSKVKPSHAYFTKISYLPRHSSFQTSIIKFFIFILLLLSLGIIVYFAPMENPITTKLHELIGVIEERIKECPQKSGGEITPDSQ